MNKEALQQALAAMEGADEINVDMQAAIIAVREVLAHPAAQAEPNEADELLKALRLDPDIYRTDGGWLNIPKIMAAITSPADYPYTKEQSK